MLLHEVCALLHSLKRRAWMVLGDFMRAFPLKWREDLLVIASSRPEVRGGCFVLLADIFGVDRVHVRLSGDSVVDVHQGIPEGGNMGTLCYNLLPDDMLRNLVRAEHGIGLGLRMPAAWARHQWVGNGSPVPELVAHLRACLRSDSGLPPASLLSVSSDLEASAARALDLESPFRLAAILHADDPVILGSSRGALQSSLDIVSSWAILHGAHSHVAAEKSVVMVSGDVLPCPAGPISMLKANGERAILSFMQSHRWLGVIWASNLDLEPDMRSMVGLPSAVFAGLNGLVSHNAVLIHMAT